jgi:heme/copper-type cytochrome/quinol oxidase subunit 2
MSLNEIIFGVAALTCLIAQVAIVRSVLRPHGRTQTVRVPRSRPFMEIVWVVLPAVVLASVLVITWRTIRSESAVHRHEHSSPVAARMGD